MGLKEKIINKIISDIRMRKGLDNEWDAIDDDIKSEIKEKWENIIKKELEKESSLKQEMLNWLIESDVTICRLCVRLNPQHKNCNSCNEQDELKQLIQKAKELDN